MNKSKVAIAVSKIVSIVQMLVGIVILVVFGICTIMCLADKNFFADTGVVFLIFCLVLDALGICLIVLSAKKTNLIKKFKTYVAVVSRNPNGYIPDIAASLGASEDVVKKNIEKMIKKKYFANAYIDHDSNCIVIANKQNLVDNTVQQPKVSTNVSTSSAASQPAEMVTVKCKGCGGINTIQKGAVAECDYCGSSIKGI